MVCELAERAFERFQGLEVAGLGLVLFQHANLVAQCLMGRAQVTQHGIHVGGLAAGLPARLIKALGQVQDGPVNAGQGKRGARLDRLDQR